MLCINDKELTVTEENIFVGPYIKNGVKGYFIEIQLRFVNEENIRGYLNLDVGYEKTNDIYLFTNRDYRGIPFMDEKTDILFEVFDTKSFYDTEIETPINISFKNINDNRFEVSFEVNDELINIKYHGKPNIIEKEYKE